MKRQSILRRNSLKSYNPYVEPLEERYAMDATSWASFGGNSQHTSISPFASQPLEAIHWSAPVDNFPTSRAAHYGGPLITAANTVIYPFKVGTEAAPDFHIIARNGNDGSLLWDETTDIIPLTDGWFPALQPVYVPTLNRVYFPAANGNLYYKDNVDTPSGVSTKVLVSVFGATGNLITTALTADANGNIYYGYRNGTNGGFVKVTPTGTFTTIDADLISGEPAITDWTPQTNHAPAISNDGQTLYVSIRRRSTSYYGRLIGLNTATMTTMYNSGVLKDPRGGGANNAGLLNQSTASPVVAPDGHVFLGVFGNPYNGSRGWLLHFNADLTNLNTSTPDPLDTYLPGGFGWDTTPSIVPASMVPQYTGTSSYLLFTKYNNYYGITNGGDGSNGIAVLDPYDSEVEYHADSGGQLVMKRVLYKIGITPDWDYPSVPTAVREWCINYGAVDPATNSIIVNSADGKFYRWHLPTNTFNEEVRLSSGYGQPYTMTVIGVDGTIYGIQIGNIFAMGQTPRMSISDAVLTEGTGGSTTATFTVSLNYPRTAAITVNYTTADGTALAGSDYTTASGALTFNPGEKSKTISVTISPDSLYELNETFFINLSGVSNAVILDSQGLGTINNDDALPSLSIADVSQNEGNSGSTAFVFTVNLSAASGATTTVNFATANGTATSGDYTTTSGTLTFTPGQTSKTISVSVTGDTVFELNDTFFVNLTGPTNASLGDNQGLGTIVNDDNVPGLSISDVTISEGGFAIFEVTLSAPSSQSVSVNYTTANGSAVSGAGGDYTANSGVITFAPGTVLEEIIVNTTNDLLDEINENFFVNLSLPTNAFLADSQGIGTITDNDPTPTVSIGDVTANEGSSGTTSFVFTVSLSAVSGRTVTVNYAAANNTATLSDNDFQASSGLVTFAAGQTTQTVTVLVNGDLVNEANESFFVNLTNGVGATILDGQGLGTILNDDASVLSIGDVSLAEGNSGTTAFVFTVSLSSPSAQTVTVNFATANDTANSPGDYANTSGMVSFNPGQVSQTFTVLVNGDILFETNETFFVNLSGAVGGTISDGQALGTITNDDALPSISLSDFSVPELDYNTGAVNVYVMLSAPSGETVTVYYETSNGTASSTSANKDYIDTFGTLTFLPGQTVASFEVSVVGDVRDEPDETIRVLLSSPVNATIADDLGIITIIDDDIVYVTLEGMSVTEGNSGQTAATVTVSLSVPADYDITIDYVTEDYGATAGVDYLGASGTVTFLAGIMTQTITVQVLGDTIDEFNEALEVVLSNATPGVELGVYPEADIDIIDDDPGPTIYISDVSQVEGNFGSTAFVFEVTMTEPSALATSVRFATQNGTANGQDYQGNVANLTFNPGQTSKTITIYVYGETKIESNETFRVNLSNPVNALIGDNQAIGTIINDDFPAVTTEIAIGDVTVTEGSNATFQVTLTSSSSQTVTVNYTTANGTALAGSDYTTTSGTLTFAPGQTTKTVTVLTTDDMSSESSETFFVNLSAPTNGIISDGQGLGTILDNEVVLPSFSISDVSQLEGNSGSAPFVFTVNLSAPSTQTTSVRFATQNGTANGIDYQGNVANVIFNPGETSKTISIYVYGDVKVESNETFFVNLSNAANAVIGDTQGVGTILNDDSYVANSFAALSGANTQPELLTLSSNRFTNLDFKPMVSTLPANRVREIISAAASKGWSEEFHIAQSSAIRWSNDDELASDGEIPLTKSAEKLSEKSVVQKAFVLTGGELKSISVED